MRGTPLDFAIVVIYFVGILAFGSYFSRFSRTADDFCIRSLDGLGATLMFAVSLTPFIRPKGAPELSGLTSRKQAGAPPPGSKAQMRRDIVTAANLNPGRSVRVEKIL